MASYDVDAARALFPVCQKRIYFNHAGVSPCSTRVRDAVGRWMEALTERGKVDDLTWEERVERVRAAAARLVGADPDEITFVRSTSHGISLIAGGLDWSPGDEVVVCSEIEYPSNVYPWKHLADRGVRLREVAAAAGGLDVAGVAAAISERTRVVAASTVQFATGARTDIDGIGALCRDAGVVFALDGIQSVGAFPIDVKSAGIHSLSADSHKWLLGVAGIGILFVDRSIIDRVTPVLVGWRSTADPWAFDGTRFELRGGATKFEEGSLPYPLIDGLGAAIELLEEIGVDAIAAHITGLLDRADAGLRALGCAISPPPERRAGILLFTPPAGDTDELASALGRAGFSISVRRGAIRISPHLYNSEEEIDRLVAEVESWLGRERSAL